VYLVTIATRSLHYNVGSVSIRGHRGHRCFHSL